MKNICNVCGSENITKVPEDLLDFFKSCGVDSNHLAEHIYKEYKQTNPNFYSFFKTKCNICEEQRVLGWEAGNSPPTRSIILPSAEIRFWPNYDYPIRKIRICKWCMPNNDEPLSQIEFLKKLNTAMIEENTNCLKWKADHPKNF